MSSLKNQLIRLGNKKPSLRKHLKPVLDVVTASHPLDSARGHSLMPSSVASDIPDLYSQEDEKDPLVHVKLFSPYSQAYWLITEYDGRDRAFGYADLGMGMGELGYISISELESAEKQGLPLVERDLYFKKKPLSKAKQ